jgi:SMODS-associated and fused to various effectors sensor domain/HNH endonuclease
MKKRHHIPDRQSTALSPVREVRAVPHLVRLTLFVKAGGRCEFDGCNKYLLEHHVTLKEGNYAEVAHIVAFQPEGARGHEKRPLKINDVDNLMLLCPGCHKLIDDRPEEYTTKALQEYKERHEQHIRHMTGLRPEHRTSVLVFTANIADQGVFVPFDQVLEAVSPRYPYSKPGKIIDLTSIRIDEAASIETARETVRRAMIQLYDAGSEVQTVKHLSVFALAPIPLLIDLGARLSNKIRTDLFQRHRDKENWTWRRTSKPATYQFNTLRSGNDPEKAALILSLSGTIRLRDLPEEIDPHYSVYELTLEGQTPNPGFLKARRDLENFRSAYQTALSAIMRDHGTIRSLHLFPAIPAPVAILCGRELLPKVHPELIVYDFDKQKAGFTFQLKVNNHEH